MPTPRKPGPPKKKHASDLYTPKLAAEICRLISDGLSLRKVCSKVGMPAATTVVEWPRRYPEFGEQIARARAMQADTLAEEILDISDSSAGDDDHPEAIQRAKLRCDARKWYASKLAPKKYGEKIEHTGQVEHTHLTLDQFRQRMLESRE